VSIIGYIQGYFCDGTCQNAISEVLSKKDASQNGIPEPFFPGIDIINTSPSPIKFWVTLYIPKPIFFRKIAVGVSVLKEFFSIITINVAILDIFILPLSELPPVNFVILKFTVY
jgi:hypothetical protein